MLGFLHIVHLALIVIFASVLRCAWSSLQLSVWVFARPSISSLFCYRPVSTSFVSIAFPIYLIAFFEFVAILHTAWLCFASIRFVLFLFACFTSCRSLEIKFVCWKTIARIDCDYSDRIN